MWFRGLRFRALGEDLGLRELDNCVRVVIVLFDFYDDDACHDYLDR